MYSFLGFVNNCLKTVNRESVDQMVIVAPMLKDFLTLERQFSWLVDGSIKRLISKNLPTEVDKLNRYLRSLKRSSITKALDRAIEEGNSYPESGSTFAWVGIFREAELFWGNSEECSLFRLEAEGVSTTAPQIIVKAWNRLVNKILMKCRKDYF